MKAVLILLVAVVAFAAADQAKKEENAHEPAPQDKPSEKAHDDKALENSSAANKASEITAHVDKHPKGAHPEGKPNEHTDKPAGQEPQKTSRK